MPDPRNHLRHLKERRSTSGNFNPNLGNNNNYPPEPIDNNDLQQQQANNSLVHSHYALISNQNIKNIENQRRQQDSQLPSEHNLDELKDAQLQPPANQRAGQPLPISSKLKMQNLNPQEVQSFEEQSEDKGTISETVAFKEKQQ